MPKNYKGCGTLTIKDTPGIEDYTFNSKEIINKIDDLKEAILKSHLKVHNYNLNVSKPKDINKGYSRIPKYLKEGFKTPEEYRAYKKILTSEKKGKEKIQKQQERKKQLKKIPAVKPIINKYDKKEKLAEEDYNQLVIYKDMMKKNPKLKKTIDKIDEIINGKFEKKEEIKPEIKQDEKPKEETKTEPTNEPTKEYKKLKRIRRKKILKDEIDKNKKEIQEEKETEKKILNDKPPENKPVQIPGKKRGRPKGSKNKKTITNKEDSDADTEKGYGIKLIKKNYKKAPKPSGNGPIGSIISKSLGYWVNYGKDWSKQKQEQEEEIARLEKELQGNGTIGENVRDLFLGPVGWVRWAKRDARERKINELREKLNEKKKLNNQL